MLRRLFLPLFFGILGTAILLWLGTWQVQRLAWKESVLAEINARIADAPVSIPQSPDAKADRYLPVEGEGQITTDEIHVLASSKKTGAIYRVVSAFETDGRRLMVDRGWIKPNQKDTPRASFETHIIGNLHWPDEIDSYTPAPDVGKNIWFARDVAAMAEVLNAEPILIVLRENTANNTDVTPFPVTASGIPNDHLQYAVTWFGLALVWVSMTLYYLRRMRTREKV
ncbi:MAG: SURF1 family protein [Cognatishimia sp.]|uniref:SURF1 family protein n=1 Tax=Cognatishimia sp. TaxID=2211648 RepID=UPI003B8D80EC